jgi:hypothetical protein
MYIIGDSTSFIGIAKQDVPFAEITWAWLILLATELLLAIIFLIATIVTTARLKAPTVKSSPLAPILVPAPELQSHLGSLQNFDEARRQAETVRVRLENGKFVLS